MSNTDDQTHAQDGDQVTRSENDTKDHKEKETKSVSFDKDVQVKRFGKPRESRSSSAEYKPPIRKEPFTHLSKEELIKEANKVRAQTESVTCTADHPPEKFYSLPHRRKQKPEEKEKLSRRNSEDEAETKKPLGRSTSDVNPKKRRERTSLSTLFRRAQKSKSPEKKEVKIKVSTKPIAIVKRSKSDVSDLKSKPSINIQPKPIRKRSGSETEEFLKSLRNKKSQLSPIIENSPRDDYFRKTPPLEAFQKKKLQEAAQNEEQSFERKVNPIEKPPRYKSPEKEPKPPTRTKRGKSEEKLEPTITETPKRKVDVKKTLLVDEIDSVRGKDINPVEIKERIKESIRKIEENIYGTKDMIHSSQQPPDKPPLTRGNTVDHIVRILKEDQFSPPPKPHLLSQNSTNVNQPFSYTKPSVSPDPNLFTRTTSPDRIPSPVNKMDKGVVYAHVVRDNVENGTRKFKKQTVHRTYSPSRFGNGNHSDEDEGLGFDDRQKESPTVKYKYDSKKRNEDNLNSFEGLKITDSPIRPRFKEYKLTSFDDFEPTYANEYAKSRDFVDSAVRGRGDGMDTMRKQFEDKVDLNFNELSHRRHLLESRLNARRLAERPKEEPVSRFTEKDPIYEAEKRMKATEKYVNETARYYRHTTERDGFAESSIAEDFNRYDSDNNKIKYNTESRTFDKLTKGDDRREFIDTLPRDIDRFKDEPLSFPPEPEYEPPSLELQKPVLNPHEYTEKKYKVKTKHLTSSHDVITTNKYKKDDIGKRKGHYASNPEINQERVDDYANTRESYHNSLRREKHKDKYRNEIRRHDSTDSYRYRDDRSPRRFDIDNRLVDSGIENDFRKDSGELHRYRRPESDDDARDTSLFLANERRHTEDNYPSEQIYANGEYITRFEKPGSRERSADDGKPFNRAMYDKSPTREDKVSAKPPKAKKLSGLEKVKQLFSRDSSKKSKKEKTVEKPRTRVLKSPEHLGDDYTRYTDPEPSEDNRYRDEPSDEEKRNRGSRNNLDRYRSPDPPDSDAEKYRYEDRYKEERAKEDRYKEERAKEGRFRVNERSYRTEKRREERRWYESSDRDSDHQARNSDLDSDLRPSRKTRSKTADPLDSPALAERYRERRRLATPSPTPSPPRRTATSTPQTSSGNWFKSLDRLTRKRSKNTKVETEAVTTEEESPKSWSKPSKPNSPAKNLRFFGDTDIESDNKHSTLTKTKSHPTHSVLRKTISNSSQEEPRKSGSTNSLHRDGRGHERTLSGHDEDRRKSGSMNSLHKEDRKYYRRNLHNISEIHSASENESTLGRKLHPKPPLPHERRSRSHSSSKTLEPRGDNRGDIRGEPRGDIRGQGRGSSSELRGSRQEIRDLKHRRRTPGTNSGESSTEESSQPSQRSVVYLHATTVGDIPDPGALARNRSRDDVSSVNSSNLQIRTTQKSFSIFAPWTPRHYSDQHDVHYAQKPRKNRPYDTSKSTSTRNQNDRPGTLQKKKSYSQTTLTRKPQSSRLTSSNTTLNREKRRDDSVLGGTIRNRKSQSNEVLNRDKISRSISMPKDKKAGWFNLTSKNKKQEINTRVR